METTEVTNGGVTNRGSQMLSITSDLSRVSARDNSDISRNGGFGDVGGSKSRGQTDGVLEGIEEGEDGEDHCTNQQPNPTHPQRIPSTPTLVESSTTPTGSIVSEVALPTPVPVTSAHGEGFVIRVLIARTHSSFLHLRVHPSTTAGQVCRKIGDRLRLPPEETAQHVLVVVYAR
ncbi:unnamed protein product, partial [Choristocarpus tenellus]